MTPPKPPDGPDLVAEGLALADLADGAMVLGHAHGEPVLLARRGDDLFAVGAKCTHYGGPLEQGLLVEDTVRCPWHHACFSLRTGEALRAPALDPVACWQVERRDGHAYVTEKKERAPLEPIQEDLRDIERDQPSSIVIIGAGAAGSAAAEMLRRKAYSGRITMIDNEESSPYDRPNLSKDYLAGDAPEDWIPLRPDGFYAQHDIEVIRKEVASLDVGAKKVHLADGSSHDYDKLLLATGAEPRQLGIPGHEQGHVHTLRSLADSRAIVAGAEATQRAVVMGASFIGLEVAASLRARGLEVHIVAPDKKPLAKVLGPELGAMVQAIHEEHGVVFHLQQTAKRIDEDEVTLENGETLPADLVVIGIGVSPRLELAKDAGLELEHGVVVNEYLQTSAPDVYAAGDIARWPDPHTGERIRVEHWVVAQRQGQTAARNMLGAQERFGMVPFFWSKHYNLSIRYSGHAETWNQLDIDGQVADHDCSVAFRQDGKTLAVASVKRDVENLEAEVALEADDEAALRHLVAP